MRAAIVGMAFALVAGGAGAQGSAKPDAMRTIEKELRSTNLLSDSVKTEISGKKDPTLKASIFEDILQAKSKPTVDAKKAFAEASVKDRLLLHQLGQGAVPDDALQDIVPGLTAVSIRQLSTARNLDQGLARSLINAFELLRKPSVMSINPETPFSDSLKPGALPPGPLPGNANPSTPGYNPTTRRRTSQVWRTGFSHVVALAPSSGPRRKIFCAGTLVAPEWIVTATHCLFDMNSESLRGIGTFSAYLPFQNNGITLFSQDDEPSPDMAEMQLDLVRWLGEADNKTQLPSNMNALRAEIDNGNDVALLRVAKSSIRQPAYPKAVELPKKTAVAPPVTVVGYGLTNATRVGNSVMEVAVRKTQLHSGDYFLSTVASDAPGKNDARVCPFDSGGPVFEGELSGDPGQPHTLVGIVSGAAGRYDGSKTICYYGQQFITRLNRQKFLAWYCDVATGACK